MKKRKILVLMLITVVASLKCMAQNTIAVGDDLSLTVGGWVRTELIYNTRAMEEGVDGLFSLLPLNERFDANGNDMNEKANVTMSAVTTRFTTTFNGPTLGKATTQAYVEMDYTAKSNTNSFMFRQGWIQLTWPKSSLLLGRAWNPLSFYSVPHVLNISMGAPFFSFVRNEQVKYSFTPGNFTFAVAASYQGQYASLGPEGKSIAYMRNSMIPDMSLVVQWKSDNLTVGAIGNTKTIQPRKVVVGSDDLQRVTDEKVTSFAAQAFAEIKTSYVSLRLNGSYTQNMTEGSMLGGYAVSDIDPLTGMERYTPTQHLNGWVSLNLGDGGLRYGLFAGYSKNLGTIGQVVGEFYGRGQDIHSLMRVAPNVTYSIKNFKFGCELERTTAYYGSPDMSNHCKVTNFTPVSNTRLLIMAMFLFK